ATSALAQDRSTTGSIGGTVVDANGAALPNVSVTVTGQTGARTVTSNDEGAFEVQNLIPGIYSVKVEQQGFKTASAERVEVFLGKQSTLKLTLEPGLATEVVQVTDVAATDLSNTAVQSNLSDTLFDNIPVQRSVTSLFYLAPGVNDSGKGGTANPSISGGSPLDNLYIADGVNITDSAFGGLGTFTRNFGTLGVGINTSFIKEVQVKTGGFEPQYGQAQGGIINIITQSGGNEYHGALYGFARPKAFEATRRQPDDVRVNKFGKMLHEENYDAGADIGGYVPGLRDKLFFFGSFNPSVRREIVRGAAGSRLETLLGDNARRYRTLNYAGKVDWNINQRHTVAFSIFGDPTQTNVAPFATLNIDNLTALNKLIYGTRSMSVRYNGALTNSWTLSASVSQGKNHFDETGFGSYNQITDRTQPARGNFVSVGYGFFEPTDGKTNRASFDTTKQVTFLGSHSFGLGYQYQRAFYEGVRDRSGPKFTVPATNATGRSVTELGGNTAAAVGQPVNATWTLFTANTNPAANDNPRGGCTLCPLLDIPGVGLRPVILRHERGEYGNTGFGTQSNYHAAYIMDTWRFNKYVTALVGIRNEQERIIGNPGATGERIAYSFTGNWAPRIGVTVDPLGKGKTKAYYNYGRFFEYIPLDLAERSLSAETDFRRGFYIPQFHVDAAGRRIADIDPISGTVIPVIDAAHL
ncbi:MAG TPA: TonB-dependent receptor, partial [Pyrinomonadaceae bacterium]|nr:TonB-dependent receptor [Pyrinomonadaceae bacterium]